jgi:hypothetical protein
MACTAWLAVASVSHAQGTTAQQATYGACLNEAAAKGIAGDALGGFVDACMQRSAAQNPGGARESSGGLLGPCYGEYCGGATGNIIPYKQAHEECWLQAMGDPSGTPASRLTPYDLCMYHRGWNFSPY